MPIKLGKSQTTVDRTTKKSITINPYIKGFARADLIEKYNNPNTRAKDKKKKKNELTSRGGVVFN